MDRLLTNILRGVGRIFPDCQTLAQAIAFNMFLAFFPMLLLALGVLSSGSFFHNALRELPERLKVIVPPGSEDIVVQYFVRKSAHPWKWSLIGLGGTLIAGSQVMAGFIEGFRVIEEDPFRLTYWRIQVRSLILLSLTIIPTLTFVTLTVFGRQMRGWLVHRLADPALANVLIFLAQVAIVFVLSMLVLVLVYRIGRPGHPGIMALFPGAAVATVLWWVTDVCFGFYVRRMPYDAVYGGLAAAIGLILWMYLTAMVILLGAAFNVERSINEPEPSHLFGFVRKLAR
ncbi:MAG: YihY/virulence factor BrkB family protein [Candidatus Acidiferrales bacterium]|jgi:membrane protein